MLESKGLLFNMLRAPPKSRRRGLDSPSHPNDCERRDQRDESGDYGRGLRDCDWVYDAVISLIPLGHLVEGVDAGNPEMGARGGG